MSTEQEIIGTRKEIGELLRLARKRAGLSLRELEEKSGIGYTHIGRIERGELNCTIDKINTVGAAIGVKLTVKNL